MFTKILDRDPCPRNWCLTWWSCFVHGLQTSVPKDAFCQVNSQFKIGIPPDVVYDIITDPGNKRVFENIQVTAQWWTPNLFSKTCTFSHLWDYLPFLLATSPSFWQTSSCAAHCLEFSAERNPYMFYDAFLMPCKFRWCTGLRLPVLKPLQEVYSRRVIEDDGERQLVEVDQAAIWRFLCFSGTFSVCVLVDQDRRTHTVSTAVNVDLSFLYTTISQFPQVSERV